MGVKMYEIFLRHIILFKDDLEYIATYNSKILKFAIVHNSILYHKIYCVVSEKELHLLMVCGIIDENMRMIEKDRNIYITDIINHYESIFSGIIGV